MKKQDVVMLVVDDDSEVRHAIASDLQRLYSGSGVVIEPAENVPDALAVLEELDLENTDIPLIVSDFAMPGLTGLELFRKWRAELGHKDTRLLLLSGQVELEQLSVGLSEGMIDGYLLKPYYLDRLETEVKKAVSQYYLNFHPERLSAQPKLVTHFALQQALEKTERDRKLLSHQMSQIKRGTFAGEMDQGLVLKSLTAELLRWVERTKRQTQVLSYAPGDTVLREGEKNEHLWFVISGSVVQEKMGKREKVELMEQSEGELLGLLSMLSQKNAFSTVRAKTACKLARISREDLELFLTDHEVDVSLFFRSLLVTLHHRITNVSEAKVQLQDAHQELKDAQVKLVESEKMATLGILTAGVAHELNNPAAALSRAADHIRSTMLEVFSHEQLMSSRAPEFLSDAGKTLGAALGTVPVSTAQLRAATKDLAAEYDPYFARKLAELKLSLAQVWPTQTFATARNKAEKQSCIEFFHHFLEIGILLGNITSCSERITSLVKGMKNYAKAENVEFTWVDVREGLEDTFVVLAHRLKRFDFEKNYPTELPKVKAVASKLNQVWTNLLTNACDATQPGGRISVTVSSDARFVTVAVQDTGSGIPIENRKSIFEPRFTTKKGDREHFGLGLGLSIVQKIVHEHAGQISFLSNETGCTNGTVFFVKLPIEQDTENQKISMNPEEKI